ncbi:hypothetical protein COBT_002619, partial [Conglomerata obtusa]
LNKSTISNAAVLEEESGEIHCNKPILQEPFLVSKRSMKQTDRVDENKMDCVCQAGEPTDSVSIDYNIALDKFSSSNAGGKVSMLDSNIANLQNGQNKNPNTTYDDAYLSKVTKECLLSNSRKIERIGEETPQSNDVIETNKTDITAREQIAVDAVSKRSKLIENLTILEHTVLEKDEKNIQNKDADDLEQNSLAKGEPKSKYLLGLHDLGPDEKDSPPLEKHYFEKMQNLEVSKKNEILFDDGDETPSGNVNDGQSTNFFSANNEIKQHTELTTVKAFNDNEDKIENENRNVGSLGVDIKTNMVDLNLETHNQREDQSNESEESKDGFKNAESNNFEGESKTDQKFIFVNEENVNNQEHDEINKAHKLDNIEKDCETTNRENKDNDPEENIIIIDEKGTIYDERVEEKSEANNNKSSANQKLSKISDDELNSSDEEFFQGSDRQMDEEYFSTEDDERIQEKTSENDKNFNTGVKDNKSGDDRNFNQPKQTKEEHDSKKNTNENESEFFNNEDEKNVSNDKKILDQIYKTTFLEDMRNRFDNWLYKIKNTVFPENLANTFNKLKTKTFLPNFFMGNVVTLVNYKNNAKYSFKVSDNLSRIWVNPTFEITFLYEKPPAVGIWYNEMYKDLSFDEKHQLGTKYRNYTDILKEVAKNCSINSNRLDFYSSIIKNAKISYFIDNNMIVDYYENCNQIYGYVFFDNNSLVFADTKQEKISRVYFSAKRGYCFQDPINNKVYYLDLKHDLVESLIEISLIEQLKTNKPDNILCVRVFSSINQFYVPSLMSNKESNDKFKVDQSRIVRNEPNIYKKIGQANLKSDIINNSDETKNDEKKNQEKMCKAEKKTKCDGKSYRNEKRNINGPKGEISNEKVSSFNKINNVYEVDTLTSKKNESNTNEKKETLNVDINKNEENNAKPQEVINPSLNTLDAENIQNDVNNNENKIDNIHEKLSDEMVDSNQNSQIKAMCNELKKFKYLLEKNEARINDNLETARTLDINNCIKDDLTPKIVEYQDIKDTDKGKNEFNKDSCKNKGDEMISFPILFPGVPIKKPIVARGKDQNKTGNNDTANNFGLSNTKGFRDLDPSKSKVIKKDDAAKNYLKDLTNDQESSVIKNVKTTFWTRKNKIKCVLCAIMIL